MMRETKFVPLHFVPYDSALAEEVFPDIRNWHAEREILALTDEGEFYQGAAAWILCLWATEKYRGWSQRLASPLLRPWAEKFCRLVAENRLRLSHLAGLRSDDELGREIGGASHGMKTTCQRPDEI